MRRALIAAAAVAALTGLAACETATPYQPLRPGSARAGGYSDIHVEGDRWRVTFAGNSLTSRETVETYLLYRAAELTVGQGFDWFETVERSTDKHSRTDVDPIPGPYGPWGPGWRPYWRLYGGWGWRGGDFGDPFWADSLDVRTVERYETTAEIIMHHGLKPEGDKHAFDARQVLANLSSKIVKPS